MKKQTRIVVGMLAIVMGLGLTLFTLRFYEQESQQPLADAQELYEVGEYLKAFPVIKAYAEKRDPGAMLTLRDMYAFELGVPYNEAEAVRLTREVWPDESERGKSQLFVARSYLYGEYREKNVERGISWLHYAAASGNLEAKSMLKELDASKN